MYLKGSSFENLPWDHNLNLIEYTYKHHQHGLSVHHEYVIPLNFNIIIGCTTHSE